MRGSQNSSTLFLFSSKTLKHDENICNREEVFD